MIQEPSAREQPLAWLISTNGFVREAFFDSKYSYCSKVGDVGRWISMITGCSRCYELDSRDEWINLKPGEGNPGLGKIKSIVTLADQVEKGKRDPTFLPTVLTKDFNMPENTSAGCYDL